jgi:hypothetical protein
MAIKFTGSIIISRDIPGVSVNDGNSKRASHTVGRCGLCRPYAPPRTGSCNWKKNCNYLQVFLLTLTGWQVSRHLKCNSRQVQGRFFDCGFKSLIFSRPLPRKRDRCPVTVQSITSNNEPHSSSGHRPHRSTPLHPYRTQRQMAQSLDTMQ